MWQKCPICNGSGLMTGSFTSSAIQNCKVCRGYLIINELTGLPPEYETQKAHDIGGINIPLSELEKLKI